MADILDRGWAQRLREQLRKMWVRVVLYSLAGVALALVAPVIGPILPYVPKINLAAGSVGSLLNIIASSMLTVTTFSMSIIVGAYGSATSNATPRATRLLAEDNTAQNAVSIFIGSFLFSVVGIIGLAADLYADNARIVLFVATLLDIALISWALLRWVNHLNDFGRMSDIIERIEQAALPAARLYRDQPALGAVLLPPGQDDSGPQLLSDQSGYVVHIDFSRLQNAAKAAGIKVTVLRMPGKYVHRGEALLRLSAAADDLLRDELRAGFSLGYARGFDQDLAYGLIVLSEVASKALSPAINDPGTAIEVLRAGTRVLSVLHEPSQAEVLVTYDRVSAPPIDMASLYAGFFAPIARDGAGLLEVQETLQDCLGALNRIGDAAAAEQQAQQAFDRARQALGEDWETQALALSRG
ncbi:DUF2254 domain-containing protein [Paracoccus sp. M683]|uniref:DUF2254 domain-containing protein n=1 Tax=Paracoccus sp. M683 TaxID=2594268 RepID=UPI00117D2A41|nr:DUF2254 domain-containing protein [Paracoccus sp. M683]TRW97467.1 DUF2254 domain-containing protein [Paracoccus sp. M683]